METSEQKSTQQLTDYKNTKSEFTDFTRFEDIESRRFIEKNLFINNIKYTPSYKYPQLDFLIDNENITAKKSAIQEAVFELEASKNYPNANIAEIELYSSYHENRLKRILLVESARNLSDLSNSEVNRKSFSDLNEALYGQFNSRVYLGIVNTEKGRVNLFEPKNESAQCIKTELGTLLEEIDDNDEQESDLIEKDVLEKLHNYVLDRYASVLESVPNTSDDVYYDIDQCIEIINKSLNISGLAKSGWKALENPSKSIVSTKAATKAIYIPSSIHRNASELRRLIIHEQEVHVRRAQNGMDSGFKLIKTGTADYADIEEGIAVILECAVDGNLENDSFYRARNRYLTAGLALGADGKPRDSREVYEILWRTIAVQRANEGVVDKDIINKSKNEAYTHIDNAYRGTNFWMKGVIFTRLKIYYEGLIKNANYITDNIDNLDDAFSDILIGKYNHTDSKEKELVLSAINHEKNKLVKSDDKTI